MKNLKKLMVVMFGAMMLMVAACSGSGSSGSNPYADAGKYVFESMSMEGESITAADLTSFGLSPDDMYVELEDDGTGKMVLFDESEDITWTAGKITDSEGSSINYTLKDGIMTMEEDGASLEFKLAS